MPVAPKKIPVSRLLKTGKKRGIIPVPAAKPPRLLPMKATGVLDEIASIKSAMYGLVVRLNTLIWDLKSRGVDGCPRTFDPDDDVPF